MIKSFRHKGLEKFFFSGIKKGIIPEHGKKLERILDRLHAANDLQDMNYPGANFRLPDPVGLGLGIFKCIAFWYLSGFFAKKIFQYAFPNSEY